MEVVIILLLILGGVTIYFFKVKKGKKTIKKSTQTNSVQIDKSFDDLTREGDLIDEENVLIKAKKRIKQLAKKK